MPAERRLALEEHARDRRPSGRTSVGVVFLDGDRQPEVGGPEANAEDVEAPAPRRVHDDQAVFVGCSVASIRLFGRMSVQLASMYSRQASRLSSP